MRWQTIGHDWAVAHLRHSLASERIAHAYLFTGPPQIGKTRLALSLAQSLNCEEPDPPCGQCRSCTSIERGAHPDAHLIGDESNGASIKIDQIRSLQREAVLAPYQGRYRVFILCQADRATVEAANSLLKILEEPPAHVVLALTAIHAESLPPTVVSRCQRLDLRPATADVAEAALYRRGVAPEKAKLLARLSGGRIGWAFCAAEDDTILSQRQQDLDQWLKLLLADRVQRLDFALKASRDPKGARRQIELWTGWWRDLLLLCSCGEGYVINADRIDELGSMAAVTNIAQALEALQALQTTATQLDANVNVRLALEGLLLGLPRWHPGPASTVESAD